jgi:hypothetical protein
MEVLCRRGWGVCKIPDGWGVWRNSFADPWSVSPVWGVGNTVHGHYFGHNPVAALRGADVWYKQVFERETECEAK